MARAIGSQLRAAVALLTLAVACDSKDPLPKDPCGPTSNGCGDRQHCDRVSVPSRCVCDEAYAGASCSECAPGYTRSGGACIAETVLCAERPCGARGECLDQTSGEQVCVCELGHAGNFCATCVDGYQDHDGDGVCQPSCGVANVACQGVEACSDEGGEARCVCATGLTGPSCDECEPGYRHDPSGDACVPTCAASDFECSGTCVETLQGARCECEPGHAGDDCESCAETHTVIGAGGCAAPLPEEALLWTVARSERQSYLGALLAPDFGFFPVVPVEGGVTDVAYDPEADVLYALSSGALVTIDQQTGLQTEIIDGASGLGHALTRDPQTGDLFVASEGTIWRADHSLQEVTELSTPGASSLSFDDARRVLLGVAPDGTRFELDPRDGSRRSLRALDAAEPLGLAVDPSLGRAYVLAALPEPPEDKLERLCSAIASGLGVPTGRRELFVELGEGLASGETRVLEDSGADPSLVGYGSLEGTEEGGSLRVETRHPDALVCIVTERERLDVVVAEGAKLRLLVLVSEEPTVSLTVEPGFSSPEAALHVRAGGDVTINGSHDRVTTHTDDEWEALGLDSWASAADLQQNVLGLVDWRSGTSTFVPLRTPLLLRGLSWAGRP